jgi:hypothetical protein
MTIEAFFSVRQPIMHINQLCGHQSLSGHCMRRCYTNKNAFGRSTTTYDLLATTRFTIFLSSEVQWLPHVPPGLTFTPRCAFPSMSFLNLGTRGRFFLCSITRGGGGCGIETYYGLSMIRNRIPAMVKFSELFQGPCDPIRLLYNGQLAIPEGKAAGSWRQRLTLTFRRG